MRRVLRVKLRAHLDREGRPSSRPFAGHFELLGSAAHRAVARQAVRESLVLLKNRHHLLPLSPHAHVLVAGDGADSIAKQSGGWTINWQDTEPNQDFPHGRIDLRGHRASRQRGRRQRAAQRHGRLPQPSGCGDRGVRRESLRGRGQGDVPTLEYSPGDKHDLALLRRLHGAGVPVVAVFLSGRPLMVNAELNAADSFVAAWLPGPEGGASRTCCSAPPTARCATTSAAVCRSPGRARRSRPRSRAAAASRRCFPTGTGCACAMRATWNSCPRVSPPRRLRPRPRRDRSWTPSRR